VTALETELRRRRQLRTAFGAGGQGQEEPQNQGAWYATRHKFEELVGAENKLIYTGRRALSAPAVGYASLHVQQQADLVNKALGLETP